METVETSAPALISVRDAAALANVGVVTIYRRIHAGQISAVRVGPRGPIRVERKQFLTWLYGPDEAA